MSFIARPTQAFVRVPEPKAPKPQLIPASILAGPLTMTATVAPMVVALTPCRLKSGWHIASAAASTNGSCAGRQPAMRAFVAASCTESLLRDGATLPISSAGSREVAESIQRSLDLVGGINGNP